jgi:hypothetical protein
MPGEIIKLPRNTKRRQVLADVLIDRITDTSNHVDLGHVGFTCASCDQTSSFDFNGLIFKSVAFYCAVCGHGYQVTNPMFTDHQIKKTK